MVYFIKVRLPAGHHKVKIMSIGSNGGFAMGNKINKLFEETKKVYTIFVEPERSDYLLGLTEDKNPGEYDKRKRNEVLDLNSAAVEIRHKLEIKLKESWSFFHSSKKMQKIISMQKYISEIFKEINSKKISSETLKAIMEMLGKEQLTNFYKYFRFTERYLRSLNFDAYNGFMGGNRLKKRKILIKDRLMDALGIDANDYYIQDESAHKGIEINISDFFVANGEITHKVITSYFKDTLLVESINEEEILAKILKEIKNEKLVEGCSHIYNKYDLMRIFLEFSFEAKRDLSRLEAFDKFLRSKVDKVRDWHVTDYSIHNFLVRNKAVEDACWRNLMKLKTVYMSLCTSGELELLSFLEFYEGKLKRKYEDIPISLLKIQGILLSHYDNLFDEDLDEIRLNFMLLNTPKLHFEKFVELMLRVSLLKLPNVRYDIEKCYLIKKSEFLVKNNEALVKEFESFVDESYKRCKEEVLPVRGFDVEYERVWVKYVEDDAVDVRINEHMISC